MQPLFDMPMDPKTSARPRWCRLAVTLDAQGEVAAVEIDCMSVAGSVTFRQALFPAPTIPGSREALIELLRCAGRLVGRPGPDEAA